MEINMTKLKTVMRQNMITVAIIICVTIVSSFGYTLLPQKTVVKSTSLFVHEYSNLVEKVSNFSGINDLQYRKIADYVAIAKSDVFLDKNDMSVTFEFLKNSHVVQMTITGDDAVSVSQYKDTLQDKIVKLGTSVYGDKILFLENEKIEHVTLPGMSKMKLAAIGGLIGVLLSALLITVKYKLKK